MGIIIIAIEIAILLVVVLGVLFTIYKELRMVENEIIDYIKHYGNILYEVKDKVEGSYTVLGTVEETKLHKRTHKRR